MGRGQEYEAEDDADHGEARGESHWAGAGNRPPDGDGARGKRVRRGQHGDRHFEDRTRPPHAAHRGSGQERCRGSGQEGRRGSGQEGAEWGGDCGNGERRAEGENEEYSGRGTYQGKVQLPEAMFDEPHPDHAGVIGRYAPEPSGLAIAGVIGRYAPEPSGLAIGPKACVLA